MDSRRELIQRSIPFLDEIKNRTAGQELDLWLNHTYAPGTELFDDLARLIKVGVLEEGWAANIEVDVIGKYLSGLLLLKTMPDSSIRMVFSNEMGFKFFDFEFTPGGGFKVNYIIKKMDRRPVIKTLRQDFDCRSAPCPSSFSAPRTRWPLRSRPATSRGCRRPRTCCSCTGVWRSSTRASRWRSC